MFEVNKTSIDKKKVIKTFSYNRIDKTFNHILKDWKDIKSVRYKQVLKHDNKKIIK